MDIPTRLQVNEHFIIHVRTLLQFAYLIWPFDFRVSHSHDEQRGEGEAIEQPNSSAVSINEKLNVTNQNQEGGAQSLEERGEGAGENEGRGGGGDGEGE